MSAAKRIGRELLVQGAPELVKVATKRKSAKQALKSTVAKTARKQIGGSLHSRITRGRQAIKQFHRLAKNLFGNQMLNTKCRWN